jgi:iron complex outermembrane receptor protein
MLRSHLKLLFIFNLFLFPLLIWAQDTLNVLDPVVVSAGFSPAQRSKTGRNIIVIRGEEISKLPVNSIDELLRYLPGLEIQARGPMGVQSDISIRGSTFQQVLVILDGIRLNDPLTGHFSSYIPLPASEIERIEILKGAASAIYGTEAVGGVIHIISKTYARTHKTFSMDATVTGGDYGLFGLNAGAHLAGNNKGLSIGILHNQADGVQQRGTKGFFNLTTASISGQTTLGKHFNLNWRSAYDDRNFSAQNFYTSFASDTATETVKTWWHHGQLSYSKGNLRWVTDVGYKKLSDLYRFNKNANANDNKSNLFQVLSRVETKLSDRSTLTGGLQYFDRQIKSNDRGNHSVAQGALFAVLNYEVLPGLQIDPALRIDINESRGAEWVPQVNISFKNKNYQLRGSAGRTTREADFTERYNNYNRTRVTSGRIGNPDLNGERAWNYEAGADFYIHNKLKLSTTLFARRQKGLIDWVNTPYSDMPRTENLIPTGNYALSKNIWAVNTVGWETDLQYNLPLGPDESITGQLGLIWLNNSGNEGIPSLYLSTQARFIANFHASYQIKKWRFSSTGLFKIRDEQSRVPAIEAALSKSYMVLNLKADYQFKEAFSAFIQVDNIADVTYSDLLGSAMPGRWLMGGISIHLGK